jgi:hypothetical protein
MGYEDRYDAICDYNAELHGNGEAEGRESLLEELKKFFTRVDKEIWTRKEILEELDGWD